LGLLDRLDLVAQPGRLLEPLGVSGGVHPAPERAHDLAVPSLEEEHHLAEVLLVRFAIDREHAGAEAALDVVLDARPATVAEHGVATRAQREDLAYRVERVADGGRTREGAEVAATVLDDPARDEDPR